MTYWVDISISITRGLSSSYVIIIPRDNFLVRIQKQRIIIHFLTLFKENNFSSFKNELQLTGEKLFNSSNKK